MIRLTVSGQKYLTKVHIIKGVGKKVQKFYSWDLIQKPEKKEEWSVKLQKTNNMNISPLSIWVFIKMELRIRPVKKQKSGRRLLKITLLKIKTLRWIRQAHHKQTQNKVELNCQYISIQQRK